MARRVSLPKADDLFKATSAKPVKRAAVHAVPDAIDVSGSAEPGPAGLRRPSGRVRHDEKMTVYVTSEELLEIEHARLSLRSEHGLVVDRGRLVREAIALVLADLELNGEGSALVARLSDDE